MVRRGGRPDVNGAWLRCGGAAARVDALHDHQIMSAPRKYPQELRERVMRLVGKARQEDPELSLSAAAQRIAARVGGGESAGFQSGVSRCRSEHHEPH